MRRQAVLHAKGALMVDDRDDFQPFTLVLGAKFPGP
jgi:hypothetical protein